MDRLHVGIALGPLGVYLLLLGIINLRRRPLLTTGARDLLALGIGVSGLLVAGPLELLMPNVFVARLGPYAWALMIGLYFTGLVLAVLMTQPRLVVYNITLDQLRPLLQEAALAIDEQARWTGDSVHLPSVGVHLHIDSFSTMRNVSLTSIGAEQNLHGWLLLRRQLATALLEHEVRANPRGYSMMGFGLLMLGGIAWHFGRAPEKIAQQLQEMLGW